MENFNLMIDSLELPNQFRFYASLISYFMWQTTGASFHRAIIAIIVTALCRLMSNVAERKNRRLRRGPTFTSKLLMYLGYCRRFELSWWFILMLTAAADKMVTLVVFASGWLGYVIAAKLEAAGMMEFLETL